MGTTKLANNITSFFSPKSTRSETAVDLNTADYQPLTSVVKTNSEETNSEEVPDDVSNDNDLSKEPQLDVIPSSSLLNVQDCKGMVPEVIRPSCAEQKPTVDQNSMLSSPETKNTSFTTTKDNKADVKSSSKSTFFSNKRKSMDLQQWLAKSSSSESEKGKLNSAGENVRHLNNSIFNLSNTEAGCVRKKRGFSSDEIDNTEENRYKRKVLCVNNDKGEGNSTPDVIPANIDESVFKELPVDIQNEIIRTCSSQFTERARGEKCKTGEGYASESIYSVPEKVLCLNETQKESDRSQNRVTDIWDSKSSVLQSSSSSATSSAAASGVASGSDGVSLGNSLDNDKHNFTNGLNVESEESVEDIPPNIDRAVFYTLPPDIKVELIQEWKQKSKGLTMKSTVNSTNTSTSTSESNTPSKSTAYKSGGSSGSKGSTLTKSSVCMSSDSSGSGRKGETSPSLASKPFFKMPKPSSTNNILSYFSKK